MSTLCGRRGRMPSRVLLVATAVFVVALVGGCGATDIPTPRRTVTVFVDPPGATSSSSTSRSATVQPVEPSSSPSGPPTALAVGRQRGAPHSYAEAKARIDGAAPATGVTDRFRSPTGNIVCAAGGSPRPVASCEVEEGRIDPPLPSICPPDGPKDIGRIEIGESGAVPVCNSDTIREGGEPELPYGSRTAATGAVSCLSEEFGVTCVDSSTQHGFFLARGTFVTF
jgi:hypothetical protein